MSIQIIDNFKLNLAVPIDSRMVTTGQSSRNSIKYVYEGLRVYDIFEKTPYVWLDGSWQKESSVGAGSVVSTTETSSAPPPAPTITTNRIVKYTSTITLGESSIFDKGTTINANVGIGTIPLTGIALDVKGMVKANSFIGTINGNNLDTKSLDISKLKPHTVTTGNFTLKTIGGKVIWTDAETLNKDIVIANETTKTTNHYLLFTNTSSNSTGTPIYANETSTTRLIGIKPSTSQILASGDTINNKNTPGYSFSVKTSSGLYGSPTEVGLSVQSGALLKLNSSGLSIYDNYFSLTMVLSTGTNKVIFTNGEFNGTLGVTGLATLSSLTVNTGTNTLVSLSPTTLNVTGTATMGNLIVNSANSTTFTSLSITKLDVEYNSSVPLGTIKLKTKDLEVTGTATFTSLTITSLNVLSNTTKFSDLNISGVASISSSFTKPVLSFLANTMIKTPLVIKAPISGTGATLTVTSWLNFNNTGGSSTLYIAPFNNTGAVLNQIDLYGAGSGILECTKLRIRKTAPASLVDAITWENSYSGRVPINDGVPTPGYEAGDIIYIGWQQPAKTNIWSDSEQKEVNLYSQPVGYHLFYTGPTDGWVQAAPGNPTGAQGDPYRDIDPNPDPNGDNYIKIIDFYKKDVIDPNGSGGQVSTSGLGGSSGGGGTDQQQDQTPATGGFG